MGAGSSAATHLQTPNHKWVAQVSLLRPGFLRQDYLQREPTPIHLFRIDNYLDLRAKTSSRISTTTRNAFKTSSMGSIC